MARSALAICLLVVLGLAWYRVLAPPAVRVGPLVPAARSARVELRAATTVVNLDRLRRRHGPAPDEPGRDPFRMRTAAPRPVGATAVAPAALSTAPQVPVWPRIELIGVAEAVHDDAVVRTAILAGAQGVHHVRVGELVEQVYRLERIGTDVVDLRLVPENRIVRRALKP